MVTATAVVWLTVAVCKMATRSVPGLLTISALVLTLQTAMVMVTGSVLFFLLQFPLANLALCVGDEGVGDLVGDGDGDGDVAACG